MAAVGTFLILVVLVFLDRVEEYVRRRMGLPPDTDEAAGATKHVP
jgi:hypothetical protein